MAGSRTGLTPPFSRVPAPTRLRRKHTPHAISPPAPGLRPKPWNPIAVPYPSRYAACVVNYRWAYLLAAHPTEATILSPRALGNRRRAQRTS